MHGIEIAALEARQVAQREFEIGHRVERAGVVMGEEFAVACGKRLRVDRTDAAQEHVPLIVRIERQQSVVKIE